MSCDLVNLNEQITDKRSTNIQSAVKMFEKFLTQLSVEKPLEYSTYKLFVDITLLQWNTEGENLFGLFGDYLMKNVALGTAENYLSSVKRAILTAHKHTNMFAGIWYTTLRANIGKVNTANEKESGVKSRKTIKMREEDLLIFIRKLLKQNKKISVFNRCLMILQWHVLGRISELSELQFSDLFYDNNSIATCLRINMSRFKTNIQHDIHVFIHAVDWKLCPLHSLACMLMINTPTDYLFKSTLGETASIVKHMNSLIGELYMLYKEDPEFAAYLQEYLSSHSVRAGSLNEAGFHPDLLIQWLILRGGWTVDRMQTIFSYLAGTFKSDAPVGRVMSKWLNDPTKGGLCPNERALPEADLPHLKLLTLTLFGSAGIKNPDLKTLLTLVVLLHLPSLQSEYPDSIVLAKILQSAEMCGISADQLLVWSTHVRRQFVLLNGEYLSFTTLDAGELIPVGSITSSFADVANCLRNINMNIFNMSEKLSSVGHKVEQMSNICEQRAELRIENSSTSLRPSRTFDTFNGDGDDSLSIFDDNVNVSRSSADVPVSSRQRSMREYQPPGIIAQRSTDLLGDNLSNLTVETVMFNWFMLQLHSVPTSNNTDERRKIGEFARNVYLYKRFLPNNTVITQRPADPALLEDWAKSLSEHCSLVHTSVIAFINSHKTDRQRKSAATFYATSKSLRSIPLAEFPAPQITDQATTEEWLLSDEYMLRMYTSRADRLSNPGRAPKMGNKRKKGDTEAI